MNRRRLLPTYHYEDNTNGTLQKSSGKYLRDYKIYGESVQDGTPSPDNPVEVQSVGDLVTEGEYQGKYKISILVNSKNWYGNTVDDMAYYVYSATSSRYGIKIEGLLPGQYTLSFDLKDETKVPSYCYLRKKVEDTLSNIAILTTETTPTKFYYTFNVNKDEEYYLFFASGTTNTLARAKAEYNKFKYIQIELGNKQTSYEEYKQQLSFDLYLNKPLRKINDYADYIDFKNQKVVRMIKDTTILALNFDFMSSGTYYRYEVAVTDKLFTGTYSENVLCNKLSTSTYTGVVDESISERNNANRLKIRTQLYTTEQELNAGIGDAKVYYIYRDASVVEEPIDLPNIPTYKGNTIISVNTLIQPSQVNWQYYRSK